MVIIGFYSGLQFIEIGIFPSIQDFCEIQGCEEMPEKYLAFSSHQQQQMHEQLHRSCMLFTGAFLHLDKDPE